jgi:hypothetical protein
LPEPDPPAMPMTRGVAELDIIELYWKDVGIETF